MNFIELLVLIIVGGAMIKWITTSFSVEIEIDKDEDKEEGEDFKSFKIRGFKFTDKRKGDE